jgi:hypothetical protein
VAVSVVPASASGAVTRRPATSDLATAARIGAALLVVAALTALVVRLAAAGPVRDLLGFGFSGIPQRLGEVISIWVNNMRLLVALMLAAVVARLARSDGAPSGASTHAVLWTCDTVLVAVSAGHAVLVGAAVGAYGERMVRGLLPHGPIELAAFSIGLALYVAARRGAVAPRRFVALSAAAAGGLAVAAAAEVFVVP